MSSIDSYTTMESTHTGSDDAEPPDLPEEAYGTREAPAQPSPGIYGTRVVKSATKAQAADRMTNSYMQEQQNDERTTPKPGFGDNLGLSRAIIDRDEKAKVPRGETKEGRSPRAAKQSSSLGYIPAGRELHEMKLRSPEGGHSFYQRLDAVLNGNNNNSEYEADNTALDDSDALKQTEHSRHSRSLRSGFLDSSTLSEKQEALKENPAKIHGQNRRIDDQKRQTNLSQEKQRRSPHFAETRPKGNSSGKVASYIASLENSITEMSAMERAESPIAQQKDSHIANLSSRNVKDFVRPLERCDDADDEFSSVKLRLSKNVTDRLMTYHILREELMKTEDQAKGRELQHAWDCVTKGGKKLKAENRKKDMLETHAESDDFDEHVLENIKNLLRNPLSHLVKKSQKSEPLKEDPQRVDSFTRNSCTRTDKPDIPQRKIHDLKLSSKDDSSAGMSSTDDTFCSRCEDKRKAKKSARSVKNGAPEVSQNEERHASAGSSTRPVTPSGLYVPSAHLTTDESYDSCEGSLDSIKPMHWLSKATSNKPSRTIKQEQKLLKDTGVMCPSPSDKVKDINPPSSQSKAITDKSVSTESITWYVDVSENKSQNAFERARNLDKSPAPMVWTIPFDNPRPWTKPALEQKAYATFKEPWLPPGSCSEQTATQCRQLDELNIALSDARGYTRYVPTLQEAFRGKRSKFISACRERQRKIKHNSCERKVNKVHDEQREQLFGIPSSITASTAQVQGLDLREIRRVIPKPEMYDRTKRMYQVLPEVKSRQKEDVMLREKVANRIRAKVFNKKVQRHVLGRTKVEKVAGHKRRR